MKIDRVNLGYESELFHLKYQEKFGFPFEAVYFFIEGKHHEKILYSKYPYSSKYLNRLQSTFGFTLPKIVNQCEKYSNWWGDLLDIKLERTLNSKITSTKIGIENGWAPKETHLVKNASEVTNAINQSPWDNFILRSPYAFSGRGHFFISKKTSCESIQNLFFNSLPKALKKEDKLLILTPLYQRILDIGVYIEFDDSLKKVKTLIHQGYYDQKGQFKGGLVAKDHSSFQDYLTATYGISVSKLLEQNLEVFYHILKTYTSIGAKNRIGIDAFFYYDSTGKIQLYPLVELNYRKTMGLFLHSMKQFLPQKGLGEFSVHSKDQFNHIKNSVKKSPYTHFITDYDDSTLLFQSTFLIAKDQRELRNEKLDLGI